MTPAEIQARYFNTQPPEAGTSKTDKANKVAKDRFAVFNYLHDVVAKTVTVQEWAVITTIWRVTRDGTAQVSLNQLSELHKISRRCVATSIKRLIDRQIIVQEQKGSNLTHQSSIYRIGDPTKMIIS